MFTLEMWVELRTLQDLLVTFLHIQQLQFTLQRLKGCFHTRQAPFFIVTIYYIFFIFSVYDLVNNVDIILLSRLHL